MPKIKSPEYRKLLDGEIINTLNEETIGAALANISGTHTPQARCLLILLYYTGARPNEILRLASDDITKDKNRVYIRVPGSKRGQARTISVMYRRKWIKEVVEYSYKLPRKFYLFWAFTGKYIRKHEKKDGTIVLYEELSDKLRYHFKKWFKDIIDIPPYYLRHNRFTKLAEKGATLEMIRQVKGSKSIEGVLPYVHQSRKSTEAAGRLID